MLLCTETYFQHMLNMFLRFLSLLTGPVDGPQTIQNMFETCVRRCAAQIGTKQNVAVVKEIMRSARLAFCHRIGRAVPTCVCGGVVGRAGAELLCAAGPVLVRTRPRKPFWRMTASCACCSGSRAVRSTTSSSVGVCSCCGGCCSSAGLEACQKLGVPATNQPASRIWH